MEAITLAHVTHSMIGTFKDYERSVATCQPYGRTYYMAVDVPFAQCTGEFAQLWAAGISAMGGA